MLFLFVLLCEFDFDCYDVRFDFLKYGCEFRFAVLHALVARKSHVKRFDDDLDFVGVKLVHCVFLVCGIAR